MWAMTVMHVMMWAAAAARRYLFIYCYICPAKKPV
jgi:hypothetical protein